MISPEKNKSTWIKIFTKDSPVRLFEIMILIRWIIIVFLLVNLWTSSIFKDFQLKPILFVVIKEPPDSFHIS